jgi:hypothetical protein
VADCDSCGAGVSAAASIASSRLDRVSPEASAAIEQQFQCRTKDIQLCATCFLAMYWMITPGSLPARSDSGQASKPVRAA